MLPPAHHRCAMPNPVKAFSTATVADKLRPQSPVGMLRQQSPSTRRKATLSSTTDVDQKKASALFLCWRWWKVSASLLAGHVRGVPAAGSGHAPRAVGASCGTAAQAILPPGQSAFEEHRVRQRRMPLLYEKSAREMPQPPSPSVAVISAGAARNKIAVPQLFYQRGEAISASGPRIYHRQAAWSCTVARGMVASSGNSIGHPDRAGSAPPFCLLKQVEQAASSLRRRPASLKSPVGSQWIAFPDGFATVPENSMKEHLESSSSPARSLAFWHGGQPTSRPQQQGGVLPAWEHPGSRPAHRAGKVGAAPAYQQGTVP